MKVLYLERPAVLSVQFEEPALRVASRGNADRLFPLARLGRVVSAEGVEWSTEALLACARAGIPVCFIGADAKLIAYWVGCGYRPPALSALLEALLDRPDGLDLYQDFRASLAQTGLQMLSRDLTRDQQGTPLHMLQRIRQRPLPPWPPRDLVEPRQRLRALVRTQVVAFLGERGLDAAGWQVVFGRLRLPDDLADILAADLETPLAAELERRVRRVRRRDPLARLELPDRVAIYRLYHGRQARLDKLLRALVNRLYNWLHGL